MSAAHTLDLLTIGTAQRYSGIVPAVSLRSISKSVGMVSAMEVIFELQSTKQAVFAWIPEETNENREALWSRVLSDREFAKRDPVWSTLNRAVIGLGLFDNSWAMLYDMEIAKAEHLRNYDQPALSRRHKTQLMDPQAVQELHFQRNALEVNLGARTPWFVTQYTEYAKRSFRFDSE